MGNCTADSAQFTLQSVIEMVIHHLIVEIMTPNNSKGYPDVMSPLSCNEITTKTPANAGVSIGATILLVIWASKIPDRHRRVRKEDRPASQSTRSNAGCLRLFQPQR